MSVLPDKMKTSAGGSVGLQGAARRPATRWKHSFSRRLLSDKPVATHADESSQQFCEQRLETMIWGEDESVDIMKWPKLRKLESLLAQASPSTKYGAIVSMPSTIISHSEVSLFYITQKNKKILLKIKLSHIIF